MGLNCGCPAGKHLNDLEIAECKESFGQIQKVIFSRLYNAEGEMNSISASASGWLKQINIAPLFAASDDSKLIISPYIQNPTTEPGEARTFGGGNQTLGGVEIIIGREPTTFTGVIYQEAQSVIKTLKTYACEKIGVYLIDENGNIGAIKLKESLTNNSTGPIPISKFFVSDKNFGGYEEPDSNNISWSFFPNWSDNLMLIKGSDCDYNPLTDLVNVKSE